MNVVGLKILLVIFSTFKLSFAELMELKCDEIEKIGYYDRYSGSKCTISDVSADSSASFVIRSANNFEYSKNIVDVEFQRAKIYDVPRELFGTFHLLKKVSANSCGIEDLHRSNFNYATSLQEMRLRSNLIKKLSNGVFSPIKQLQSLDLTSNIIAEIEPNAFIGMSNLEYLTLSDNKIVSLDVNVFNNLTSLKSVRLDANKLQIIDDNLFANNLELNEIRLDSNEIAVIGDNTFGSLQKLKIVNIGSNRLHKVDIANSNIERLSMAYNKVKTLNINPNMKYLYAPYNELVELSFIGGGSKSEMLEMKLRKNLIADFTNISSLVKLEVLDVSSNPIGALDIDSFARMNSLVKLNLEFTNITKESLMFGTFAHNPNLTQLDLSYNQLKHIDFNIFSSLTQLTHLKIDGNNLTEIPYENIKAHFPKLSLISLTDNDWNCAYLSNMTKQLRLSNVIVFVFSSQRVFKEMNVDGIRCHYNKTQHVYWNTPFFELEKFANNDDKKSNGDGSKLTVWDKIVEIQTKLKTLEAQFDNFKGGMLLTKIEQLAVSSSNNNKNDNDDIAKSEINSIKVILCLMLGLMILFMLMGVAKIVKVFMAKRQFYYPSEAFRRSTATIQTTMEHVM